MYNTLNCFLLNSKVLLIFREKKATHYHLFRVWVVENQSQCHHSEIIMKNVQNKGLWQTGINITNIYINIYFLKSNLKFTISTVAEIPIQ